MDNMIELVNKLNGDYVDPIDSLITNLDRINIALKHHLSEIGYYNGPIDPTWNCQVQSALERYKIKRHLNSTKINIQLIRGDNNPLVEELQRALNLLSLRSVQVSGIFDGETESIVKIIQAGNGLDVTGVVDLLTWNVILEGI